MPRDSIHLANVRLVTWLGVPEAERARPQTVALFLTLWPSREFEGLADEIGNTLDYSAVRATVRVLAAERPRRLLETLAADLAAGVLAAYPACAAVDVELRKFVLPDTDYVAARLSRQRGTIGS